MANELASADHSRTTLAPCPFCGTEMLRHKGCFSHPHPAEGDCILRHYSFDKQKARDWNRRTPPAGE